MHADRTVLVSRPAEVVFEFLADGRNRPRWREDVREIALMTRWPDAGAVYRQVVGGPGGRAVDCDYLITGYEPPRRLEFVVVAGPIRPAGSLRLLERDDGTTEVTYRLESISRGVRRLLTPLEGRAIRHEVAQLDRLKAALEQEHSAV